MLGSTVRRRLLARLGLPLPRLDAVLSHGRGSVYLQRKIAEAMLRIIINHAFSFNNSRGKELWYQSCYPMELEVESAGVADGLALVVPPPQRRRRRAAVGALQAGATISTLD